MLHIKSLPVIASIIASVVILLLTTIITLTLSHVDADARTQAAANRDVAMQILRWQHDAPLIFNSEASARNRLQQYCSVTSDLNGALLAIVRSLNTNGVVAKATDYVANYPVSTPMPLPTETGAVQSTTQIAAALAPSPSPSPFVAPTTPAQSMDAHIAGSLVVITKGLELDGPYPAIERALASLNELTLTRSNFAHPTAAGSIALPITIEPPSFDRVADASVSAKTFLTLSLPPPDICNAEARPTPHLHLSPKVKHTT